MTLIRWNPLRDVTAWHPVHDLAGELSNMQREIDRVFDRFHGSTTEDGGTPMFIPAVDIIEREGNFDIRVELSGVKKEDVKITVQNDVLTIRGEKKQETEKKGDNFHRVERAYGTFERSFTLPSMVHSDKIDASYNNGVLTVSVPKMEEAKPKEIEVKVK
jgi:HSP20 family protein